MFKKLSAVNIIIFILTLIAVVFIWVNDPRKEGVIDLGVWWSRLVGLVVIVNMLNTISIIIRSKKYD